jgi:glycerol-3-phosphate cytidylyltransferase
MISIKEARKRIEAVQKAGLTVGLCSGCFDFIHKGHINHFLSAKKFCDHLIIAVSNDKAVSKRKGAGRPVFRAEDSAWILENLVVVSGVIINPYDNSVELIKKLKPDFYIKGPDYKDKETPGIVAERKAIKSVGGAMKYTSDSKFSTTQILDKIRGVKRKKSLYVLDRDGTLIEDANYLGSSDDWKKKVKFRDDVINSLIEEKTKSDITFIVVTNQTGVARKFFSEDRVIEINDYLDKALAKRGLKIFSWNYCPHADWYYAFRMARNEGADFDLDYVLPTTKRKPSPQMVWELIDKLGMKPEDFDKIIVVGDSEEDRLLAENLNAGFINVKNRKLPFVCISGLK